MTKVKTVLSATFLSTMAVLLSWSVSRADTSLTNSAIEVKIGVIIPLTGTMAASGQAFREAALMGLEDSKSWWGDLKFSLHFEDDQLVSKNAATAASKLISQDKVAALLSTWSYGGSVVAPLAQKAKVLHFSVAWANSIAKGEYNFLHLMPPKSFIPAIFDVLEKKKLMKIGAVVASEAGSIYSLDELERLAPSRHFAVVSREETAMDESDFRSVITRIMKKSPEVLYVNIFGGQLNTFIQQLRNLGHNIPVVIQTGLSTVSDLKPYENYWYVSDAYFPEAALEERLINNIGHHNTLYAANFYDSVRALVYALSMTRGTGDKLPSAEKVVTSSNIFSNFPSIFPAYSIDSDGVFLYAPRYYRIVDGKAVRTTLTEIVDSKWWQ